MKQQRSSVLSQDLWLQHHVHLRGSFSSRPSAAGKLRFIYRAQKGCYHGDNSSYGRQNQSGSLEANDHSNQRGLLRAHLRHLFFPQLLEPADPKESQSEPSTAGSPPQTAVTPDVMRITETKPDLVVLTSASSKGESLRLSQSSFLLNAAHIMGVTQAKVAKDRKPALSTGWGLQEGTTTASTPEHLGNYTRINVKMPTVMRRSGRVSTP